VDELPDLRTSHVFAGLPTPRQARL
jgi:hypothetical protein